MMITIVSIVQEFALLYGTRGFIIVPIRTLPWSVSLARWTHSTSSSFHSFYDSIIFSHLRRGLPCFYLPFSFTKILYVPMHTTCTAQLILPDNLYRTRQAVASRLRREMKINWHLAAQPEPEGDCGTHRMECKNRNWTRGVRRVRWKGHGNQKSRYGYNNNQDLYIADGSYQHKAWERTGREQDTRPETPTLYLHSKKRDNEIY